MFVSNIISACEYVMAIGYITYNNDDKTCDTLLNKN